MKTLPLNEVYRPKEFEELVGFKEIEKIKSIISSPMELPNLLFYGNAGYGKCVDGNSVIFVNNTPMTFFEYEKNVNDNDKILSINKKDVKGYLYTEVTDKLIKITLNDGTEIEGTPEHKIKVLDTIKGIEWKAIGNITPKDCILVTYNHNRFNKNEFPIPVSYEKLSGDHTSNKLSVIPTLNNDFAYLLGCIIGNGSFCKNAVTISTYNTELQNLLLTYIKKTVGIDGYYTRYKGKKTGITISSCRFKQLIHKLGVEFKTARYKTVPLAIRKSPLHIQLQFLKGLLDTDSYFNGFGIEYYTASKELVVMVRNMLLNIGIYCKISSKYLKKYTHTYWTITISSDFTRKLISLFDGKYKLKPMMFGNINNTNVGRTHPSLGKYVQNTLKTYNYKQNGTYIINDITVRTENKYTKLCKIIHNSGISNDKFEELLNQKGRILTIEKTLDYIKTNGCFLVGVKNIEKINTPKPVYDFTIPENKTFISNGLINHNTTLARIVLNKLNPIDVLRLNGSDKNDRNIETISNKLMEFGMSMSTVPGKPKLVFIDEIDKLTPDAFDALRGNIEKVVKNCRFIATANYLSKIPEPVQSRFNCIEFKTPTLEEVLPRIEEILSNEGITYEKETISSLITSFRFDLRSILNSIQLLSSGTKSITPDMITGLDNETDEIYNLIIAKEWSKIRYLIPDKNLDYNTLLVDLDNKFFNSELLTNKKAEINDILAKGMFEMSFSFKKDICFSAICYRIIKVI